MSEPILASLGIIIDGDQWHYDAVSRNVTGPDDEQFVLPRGLNDPDVIEAVVRLLVITWRDGEQAGRRSIAAEFRNLNFATCSMWKRGLRYERPSPNPPNTHSAKGG